MALHNDIGKFSEEIAANLLTQKRMKITGAELAANSKPRRWKDRQSKEATEIVLGSLLIYSIFLHESTIEVAP